MNEEQRNAPETNPYVPSSSLQPTGTWLPDINALPMKLIVFGITTFLIGVILLGTAAEQGGCCDYTRDIPITEAIEHAWNTSWGQVISRGPSWFLLACAFGLIGYLTAPTHLRIVVYTYHALIALLCAPLAFITVFFMPWILLNALSGRADGEDWSEGMIIFGAVGYWSFMWLILLGTAWLRHRSLQNRTWSQTFAHFLRQVNGR
jgi:hypothetical protein